MPDVSPPSRARRRWRLFSLRTLMAFIVVIGIALGWWDNSAREQATALATIREFDPRAQVIYEQRTTAISRLIPVSTWRQAFERRWPPAWLERSLGTNYWRNINTLVYGYVESVDPERAREAIIAVSRLRGLKELILYASVTDADVDRLASLPALEYLFLAGDCSGLTDVGLRSLSRLTSLRLLAVGNAPITDAGLVALGNLSRLTSLSLNGSRADNTEPTRIKVTGTGLDGLTRLQALELRSRSLKRCHSPAFRSACEPQKPLVHGQRDRRRRSRRLETLDPPKSTRNLRLPDQRHGIPASERSDSVDSTRHPYLSAHRPGSRVPRAAPGVANGRPALDSFDPRRVQSLASRSRPYQADGRTDLAGSSPAPPGKRWRISPNQPGSGSFPGAAP